MAFRHSYIGPSSAAYQPTPSTIAQNSEAPGSAHHAVTEPDYSLRTYNLEEYAFVSINSIAGSTQDVPLVYFGEQITGSVVFPEHRLHEVRRIVVGVSWLSYQFGITVVKSTSHSYGCLYLTLRIRPTRQRLCSRLSKSTILISQTTNSVGALPLRHLLPPTRHSQLGSRPIPL